MQEYFFQISHEASWNSKRNLKPVPWSPNLEPEAAASSKKSQNALQEEQKGFPKLAMSVWPAQRCTGHFPERCGTKVFRQFDQHVVFCCSSRFSPSLNWMKYPAKKWMNININIPKEALQLYPYIWGDPFMADSGWPTCQLKGSCGLVNI